MKATEVWRYCAHNAVLEKMQMMAAHESPTQAADITKKSAAAVLETVTDIITKDLKKGNNVVITGFGTFRVSKRAARTGVNPRNPSEKIKIPAMKVPTFKAGKALKEAVR